MRKLNILLKIIPLIIPLISTASPNNDETIKNICSQFTSIPARQLCINSAKGTDLNNLSSANIAKLLGWVCDPKANLCGGYYQDPANIIAYPNPQPIKIAPTTITAKGGGVFTEYGTSILTGDVNITQPGRAITANRGTLLRDKTGKISDIDLLGDVKLHEYGKTIVAKHGHIDFKQQTTTLNDAIYRMNTEPSLGANSIWGKTKRLLRDNTTGVLHLFKASYSTCPPASQTWYITGSHITLDKNTGRGTATNMVLHAKEIPVAYLPYINFPIDKQRKSGFLYPTPGYSSQSGYFLTLPYYLNLAPNYDLTLTPEIMKKRGIFTDALFRYLTEKNSGSINFGYIPHDNEFANFQKNPGPYSLGHALSHLGKISDQRGYFAYKNTTIFNQHWNSNINLGYVSDDYFQQDYFQIPNALSNDQIMNQANIDYNSEHWSFSGRLLAFQTLHPVTLQQGNTEQYMRLPQLNLDASYPDQALHLTYQVNSQFTRFDHRRDFDTGAITVIGDRLNINPSISLPLYGISSYIVPKLDLSATKYALKDQQPNLPTAISQIVPEFSIDSGLFFNRDMKFLGQNYTQSLEPRLYYLYVPARDQNELPMFDTTLPTFNFENLFRNNRFAGIDRIGDANQITLALTTRFLDDYSGQEKMKASLGQIYAFHKHDVLCPTGANCTPDPLATNKLSPLFGELQYSINPLWDVNANTAWNQTSRAIDNGSLTLKYHNQNNRIVNFGYNFIKNGDVFNDDKKDLNRIDFSFAWPLNQHWSFIGDWNYNLSYIHPQTYFFGLEYDSCCFAIRAIEGRTFTGKLAPNNKDMIFDTQTYVQFLFKGLGAIGNEGANTLITSRIPNYHDTFVK